MSEAAKAAERIELLFNRVRREAWPSDPNDDALAISEDYPIKFCSTVEFKNPPTTNEVTAEIQAAIDATHSELEQLRQRVKELEAENRNSASPHDLAELLEVRDEKIAELELENQKLKQLADAVEFGEYEGIKCNDIGSFAWSDVRQSLTGKKWWT